MIDDRLAHLEQRLARVENELARSRREVAALRRGPGLAGRVGHTVRVLTIAGAAALATLTLSTAGAAPSGPRDLTVKSLRVVDGAGVVQVRLTQAGLLVGTGSTPPWQAAVISSPDGGQVVTRKSDGSVASSIGATGGSGQLEVSAGPAGNALIGPKDGRLSLRFYKGDTIVGGMGADADGGFLQLNDKSGTQAVQLANTSTGGLLKAYGGGQPRAALEANTSGQGALYIYNNGGTAVASLESHAGGGYLGIGNAAGNALVEGGVLSSNTGVIRTFGPKGFNFIKGKEG